jgi:hypothetical protein
MCCWVMMESVQMGRSPGQETRPEAMLQPPLLQGGLCLDLVVCIPHPSLSGSTSPGVGVPVPRSLGTVDPGVARLRLLGYPGTLPLPVSLKQVENNAG